MNHVVLLGDSVFDNAAYTRGEPDVVSHLRRTMPNSSKASLLAIDGATIAGLERQLQKVPADATHLVVSVGGNDALANIDLLNSPVRSTAEALSLFDSRVVRFERDYRQALRQVTALGHPTTVCTIYNGQLADEREARNARVALMMFNDAILRTAFDAKLSVIELRAVCTEPSDYANPIEPSGGGGAKIAQVIGRVVAERTPYPVCHVFTGCTSR